MKEQTRYNSTPEQGWAKMKPVLDQVMPQSKPPKRLVFLWWAASAVVFTGLIGVLLMEGSSLNEATSSIMAQNNDNAPITSQLDSKSIADQFHNKESVVVEQPEEAVSVIQSNQESRLPSQNQSGFLANNSTTLETSEMVPIKTDASSVSGIAFGEVIDKPASVNDLKSKESNSAKEILTSETIDNSEVFASPASLQRNMVIVEPLFVNPVPMISNEENNRPFTFSEAHAKAKRNPVWFRPTLVVSSLFGQNGGLGIYGGAGVDVNFNRQISLTTAFGYSSYKPNANLFGSSLEKFSFNEQNTIVNTDPLSGLDRYVYSESINVEADYSAINPLVESVSQWQVDIGLNWRFSRRWYANGGVKFGFSTEAYSQYPIVRGGPPGFPNYPPVELGNALSDYNVIRNSSTSMFVGIGYRISRHFDVLANWTHGFDQYVLNAENIYTADLSTGERTDYIRGLTIGLKYTL